MVPKLDLNVLKKLMHDRNFTISGGSPPAAPKPMCYTRYICMN